jgi:hypothetical protein
MVNGVSTNASDCEISALRCWSWGLTVGQYYRVLAVIFAVLALPIFFMREVSSDHIPLHSFAQHGHALWETLQNPTTLYLLVFVSANGALSQLTHITYNYVQYTLVHLTNLQDGVQVVVTYLAVAVGVKIFQIFFLNRNWCSHLVPLSGPHACDGPCVDPRVLECRRAPRPLVHYFHYGEPSAGGGREPSAVLHGRH